MTRDEKIQAIYEKIANKELTFGCKLKFDIGWKKSIYNESDPATEPNYWIIKWECEYEDSVQLFLNYAFWSYAYFRTNCEDEVPTYSDDYEIIWHPVMIGDVLDWIEPYWWVFAQSVNLDIERTRKGTLLLSVRKQKRKPIDDQSDECIDYVYSLIPKS